MYNLGLCYRFGTGVALDIGQALKWWRAAATCNYSRAMSQLASMYALGKAGPPPAHTSAPDFAEAARWARKAAVMGDCQGQAQLASYLYGGLGVPQDSPAAFVWWGRCVAQKHVLNTGHNAEKAEQSLASIAERRREPACATNCRRCAVPGGQTSGRGLLKCAGCAGARSDVSYCCRACQLKDWPAHKKECKAHMYRVAKEGTGRTQAAAAV